jgi:aminoglycoside 3-N-acetyltransferase
MTPPAARRAQSTTPFTTNVAPQAPTMTSERWVTPPGSDPHRRRGNGARGVRLGADAVAELEIVQRTVEPRTRQSLAADLARLGLSAGTTVIAHASLSSLGWVSGGAVAVLQALLDVLGGTGTLVMPTHTADNSDPAAWSDPPVPESWHQVIRDSMPAFDPAITPTRRMGVIAELFRSWPGALRSIHPSVSFAAFGSNARRITEGHGLDYGLGESSPLARIYELGGQVLLLGAGFDSNTSFHLAEHRAGLHAPIQSASAFHRDGARMWGTYADIEVDSEPFAEIGAALEATGVVRLGQVGSATARLFPQREAVDFAVHWLKAHGRV